MKIMGSLNMGGKLPSPVALVDTQVLCSDPSVPIDKIHIVLAVNTSSNTAKLTGDKWVPISSLRPA